MDNTAPPVRSLAWSRIWLTDRLRKAFNAPWKKHLRQMWEGMGGIEVAGLIYSSLVPATAYLGFTRDAELVLWAGPGWEPPRHVCTFRLFQIGSAATRDSEDALDQLQCVTLLDSRLIAATKSGRVASFPMDEEQGEVRWFYERLGICDITNDGDRILACLEDGSILSMDMYLQFQHHSIRWPAALRADWKLAVGHSIFTAAPEARSIWCWPKRLNWITNWPIPALDRDPERTRSGVRQIRCVEAHNPDKALENPPATLGK